MFDKRNVKNLYALTPLQEGILFHSLLDEGGATYFEQARFDIHGRIEIPLFQNAWNELIKRHDVLRTIFVMKNVPQPLQIVLKKREITINVENLIHLDDAEQLRRIDTFRVEDRQTPFTLSSDLLIRITLFQRDRDHYTLVWSFHHIIMDGWSVSILYEELATLYAAQTQNIPVKLPQPVQFGAYIKWLKGKTGGDVQTFWKTYLDGYNRAVSLPKMNSSQLAGSGEDREIIQTVAEQNSDIPSDQPTETTLDRETTSNGYKTHRVKFELNGDISRQLTELALKNKVTVNTLFQALWGIMLAACNDINDVVFGITVSGRPADIKGIERMVGLFINAVPVRIAFSGNDTFRALLAELHADATAAREYHYSSLADIQAATPLRHNLFDQLLVFENYPNPSDVMQEEGEGLTMSAFDQFEQTNYDLTVEVFPGNAIEYEILYNPNAFEASVIEAIPKHIERAATSVIENADIPVIEIQVLSEDEKETYHTRTRSAADDTHLGVSSQKTDEISGTQLQRKVLTRYAAAETDIEAELVTIWDEVLERSPIGIDDNFFEIGGHSLKATRIVSRLHKVLGVEVTLQEFFRHSDIRALAHLVEIKKNPTAKNQSMSSASEENAPNTPIARSNTKITASPSASNNASDDSTSRSIPLCSAQEDYEVSHAQRRLWILDQMEDEFTAYNQSAGFIFEGKLNPDLFKKAMALTASRHESLRTVFIEKNGEPRQRIISFETLPKNQEKGRSGTTTSTILNHGIHDLLEGEIGVTLPVSEIDLSADADPDASAQTLAAEMQHKTFDLANGPLWEVTLVRLAPERHLLLLNMHHIICDGWSLVVLENEVMTLYQLLQEKKVPAFSPLPLQYKDYAAWQNRRLSFDELTHHQTFWHSTLGGALPVLNLPTDFPRPLTRTYVGAAVKTAIDTANLERFQEFCTKRRVSLFMGLTAILKVLLFRYTNQTDLIIGSPVAGRNHTDLEGQIGFFVNTIVLRDHIEPEESFETLLNAVSRTVTSAFDHQSYPFDRLVEELDVLRDVGRSPIFDVMLVLQNNISVTASMTELKISELDVESHQSQFDLTLIFSESEEGLTLEINYNTDLFREDTLQRMAGHFDTLLYSAVTASDTPISKLQMLTDEEQTLLTAGFNRTSRSFPEDDTLASLFEKQVIATPDNEAVRYRNLTLTYRELNRQADAVGNRLQSSYGIGKTPDQPVAVLLNRSHLVPVTLLAVLKAGGAYLPLDAEMPLQRLQFILSDSNAGVLITESPLLPMAEQLEINQLIILDDVSVDGRFPVNSLSKAPEKSGGNVFEINIDADTEKEHSGKYGYVPNPTDLAYIIYTSGSTGNPKGVMVEHRSFINMILAQIEGFEVEPDDRVLQFASLIFDASMSEIFMGLLSGASVIMVDKHILLDTSQFIQELARQQVTVITLPPVYLKTLAHHPLPTLKTIITAGEPAIKEDALFYSRTKRYFNAYGPTETAVCTSFHQVGMTREYGETIPIGAPIANNGVYILDMHLNPVPIGVPGELCFAGVGVARGYLNRSDLTREKFIQSPFESRAREIKKERLYRIGDLGRWLPDGEIEFLGRVDEQVKIRGFRIEPGEIAAALKSFPGIQDALVLVWKDHSNADHLAAYMVMEDLMEASDIHLLSLEIRSSLSESLPNYMIPHLFIPLDAFPLTINGKIDKRALPDPKHVLENRLQSKEQSVQGNKNESDLYENRFIQTDFSRKPLSLSPVEAEIKTVWQRLFNRDDIQLEDDFFLLGGDSIRAIRMVSLLREKDLIVKVKDIFKWPTISDLALNGVCKTSLRKTSCGETRREHAVRRQLDFSGTVPMTPIYSWFFDHFKEEAYHFNHSDLFFSDKPLDPDALNAAIQAVISHHEMLRLTCKKNANGIILEIPPLKKDGKDFAPNDNTVSNNEAASNAFRMEVIDLRNSPLEEAKLTLTRFASEAQSRFDLHRTSLFKVMLFKLPDGDRLLFIMHHLLGDAVSWRIIMDDFESGYDQYIQDNTRPISLPLKSDPFPIWAFALTEYATSGRFQNEKRFWQTQMDHPYGHLPNASKMSDSTVADVPEPENALMKEMKCFEFSLNTQKTETVRKSTQTLKSGIDKMLLAALAWCFKCQHGHEATLISMESYGRPELFDDIDVSRTVGWFTAQYPLLIHAPDGCTPETALKSIADALERIPNNGIGWGVLQYLTPPESGLRIDRSMEPDINFNYLGEFENYGKRMFISSKEEIGSPVSGNAPVIHDLDINAVIAEQKLHILWHYNEKRFTPNDIKKMTEDFSNRLMALCRH